MTGAAATLELTIVPANESSWEDLQAVLGRGYPSRCQCQRHKIRGREWDSGSVAVEKRAAVDFGRFAEVSRPTLRRVVMRINF